MMCFPFAKEHALMTTKLLIGSGQLVFRSGRGQKQLELHYNSSKDKLDQI